ncbi:methyltransferase B [Lophiostoma macrostomum CBS 122681]|uniref:Methyltransferase B n=1 Tax=Lophiostoma macrostomum CBS 122681 TaxID=1314788 RepID=A0A6A6TN64_9PLEO|nr:methyltransferase B [Lophiostoma macrostomum CBS 122681]
MDTIATQIRELYSKANEEERRKIQNELRDLQTSLDTEWDVLIRLGSGMLEVALVRIGLDLDVFGKLDSSTSHLTLDDLASQTGAAPKMLGRLLRAQASFGMITETGPDQFTANHVTKILANENVAPAMVHVTDVHCPVSFALPEYLKTYKYQDITSNKDLPFHLAMKTDLAPFEWMKQTPGQMKALGHVMSIQRETHWIDSYAVEKEVGSFAPIPDSALLVDVGGGFGQQASLFKNKFSSLPGRVVVQDIPETLDRAPPAEGIEFITHDFFTPQDIKGAKFYYLRHILHDWSDEDSVKILKEIVPAMGPDSRIVIDEIVLPNSDVSWQAAYMDLTMMSCLGGVERTKAEFEKVVDDAGLKIIDVQRYDAKMQSVILAIPK